MSSKLIQSYVNHGPDLFFVSTINRQSSAMDGGTYAETMVWRLDPKTRKYKDLLGQDEGAEGCIKAHLDICLRLHNTGNMTREDA